MRSKDRDQGGHGARPRVAILLSHDQECTAWRKRHADGLTLDETPYGYHRAVEQFDLRWSGGGAETRRQRAVRRLVSNLLGFDLVHAWRNRAVLAWADVIWTHTEREHLAVSALKGFHRGVSTVPVLAQSVWMWDEWPTYPPWRRRLYARLLRRHAVELVHSRLNLDDSCRAAPGRRVLLIPFGSAAPSATVQEIGDRVRQRPLVLAVGNDRHRDWKLLASVARGTPEADYRVASSSRAARSVSWPTNVLVERASSVAELTGLYADASVVALPLLSNRHASGATTCIEAMNTRRRIVASRAGGLEDYLDGAAHLVEIGDVDGFIAGIRSAIRGEFPPPSLTEVANRGLTQEDYVSRYVAITRSILGLSAWDPSVSMFAPYR